MRIVTPGCSTGLYHRQTVLLLIFAVTLLTLPASAQVRSSLHYTVEDEVIDSGGNAAASTHYSNVSSTGQSSTVGVQVSTTYENQSGFWHTVLLIPPIPAVSAAGIALLLLLFSFIVLRRNSVKGKEIS